MISIYLLLDWLRLIFRSLQNDSDSSGGVKNPHSTSEDAEIILGFSFTLFFSSYFCVKGLSR